MNPITLILVAIFSNFFGWFIVNKYCTVLDMTCAITPFNEHYFGESIFELAILYFFLLIVGVYLVKKQEKIIMVKEYHDFFYKGYGYWLLTFFLVFNTVYNIVSLDFAVNLNNRGVGQFNRDISSAIDRLSLLIFPMFVFYRLAYIDKKSILISNLFLATVFLSALATADRRILFYYIIAFLMINFYESKNRISIKIYFYIFLILLLLPLLYLRRFDGDFSEMSKVLGFVFLQSSLGALGVSAILPEVKYLIANNTGYLYGRSFILYFLTLLVPSALMYFLGGDEFYFRSSLYFDELFNTNPNMGYDFMMVADFYWNFSYFGYVLYGILTIFIFYTALGVKNKNNIKNKGMFIILVVFFIAGQRSDFGLFLKSTFYCAVLYYLLCRIMPRTHKRNIEYDSI